MDISRGDKIIKATYTVVFDPKRGLEHEMVVCEGNHCHIMDSNEFVRVLGKLMAKGYEVDEGGEDE